MVRIIQMITIVTNTKNDKECPTVHTCTTGYVVYFLLICPWSLNYAVTIQQISTCYHCLILPMQSERVQGRHHSTADRCYLSSYAGSFYCLLSLSISQSIKREREREYSKAPPPPSPPSKPESRSRPALCYLRKICNTDFWTGPGLWFNNRANIRQSGLCLVPLCHPSSVCYCCVAQCPRMLADIFGTS